jgi:hypothetical protein
VLAILAKETQGRIAMVIREEYSGLSFFILAMTA